MKERKTNFELLRIISMCGVIILHYMGETGIIQSAIFPEFSWFFRQIVYSFCVPTVNCFVLITGYFLIEKNEFCLRKPIVYFVLTMFYGAVGYVFGVVLGTAELSLGNVVKAIFPFVVGKRWFVETYIILILFSPYLAKLLRSLKREHYQILLAVQLLLFSVWYSIGMSAPVLDNGYGITNFITLYMIGGYIRLHGEAHKCMRWKKYRYILAYVALVLIAFTLSYFVNPFGYAYVTNILSSATLFLFFVNWDARTNRVINKISAATFDTYFTHGDMYVSHAIYSLLGIELIKDTPWMIPHLIPALIIMWLIGYVSWNLRRKLFAKTIDKLLDKIEIINWRVYI